MSQRSTAGSSGRRGSRSRSTGFGSNLTYGGERNIWVMCDCGVRAEIRRSTTTNNPGKLFFGCRMWDNGGCNMFLWYDDVHPMRRVIAPSDGSPTNTENQEIQQMLMSINVKASTMQHELRMLKLGMFIFIFLSMIMWGMK